MELKARFSRTAMGLVPGDWQPATLKQISIQITDGDHVTPARARDGYLLLSARNVRDGFVDLSDVDYVGESEFRRMRARCAPEGGDLLISCSGHGLGRVAVLPVGIPCVLVRSAALVKVDPKKAYPLFIQYWLQGANARKQIADSLSRAAQPNLFLNSIEKLDCPLPPTLDEQHAIAEALSDVDALLGGLNRLITKKRDLKQGVMRQLLTGQTRLPGFGGEWEVKRLGDVIDRIVGGGTPARSNPAFWRGPVPWVTVKDFATFNPRQAQESITELGLQNSASNLIPAGTLITSTRMALGKTVLYEVDVAINQDLKALFLKRGTNVHFLRYWFEQQSHVIDALGSGSTVKGISIAELRSLAFPQMPFPEQTAIAAVLSDMDTELAALEQHHDKTRGLKQAMMQELLTGRTRLVKPEAVDA